MSQDAKSWSAPCSSSVIAHLRDSFVDDTDDPQHECVRVSHVRLD